AREARRYKDNYRKSHRRYYGLAGITIGVESPVPITDETYHPKLRLFEVDGPGDDNVTIKHYFSIPDLSTKDLGEIVYRKSPWAIYRKGSSWIYRIPEEDDRPASHVAVVTEDQAEVVVYHARDTQFRKGSLESLT
ncbi:MAG: hypothetical protein GTO63_08350, partial [Anaerolineae bacterium]|nr:hypothetical protein [Anaerolineae bacterium]NIN94913.1 hypothetical protein [Anaerolineae bacterium]NIQ80054.1 hypothetical protein [Anaerolineae bacterium]